MKIIEVAEQLNTSLIVPRAIGLHATLGILVSGVAQQVIEYANWPVLVARAPYKKLKHILLVTDGSKHSQRVARYLEKFPIDTEYRGKRHAVIFLCHRKKSSKQSPHLVKSPCRLWLMQR